jgi:hypothetical protein
MRFFKRFGLPLLLIIIVLLTSTACRRGPRRLVTFTPGPAQATAPQAAVTPTAAMTLTPTQTPLPGPFGPTGYPANVNPLTGQFVSDPNLLNKRPILVKVSNESPAVRPQAGLQSADNVWEYQMENMAVTRFTAVFYGQSPERVGSVRSARLIDVNNLVDMYGGILVNSGASSNYHYPGTPPRVLELLRAAKWGERVVSEDYVRASYGAPYLVRIPDMPRPATADYHTLFAFPAEIWKLATEKGWNQKPNLEGFAFNFTPPGGGTPTTGLDIDFGGRGFKRSWRYNPESNKWLASLEDRQGAAPDTPDQDYLTGKQLAFDNVMIVYAAHYPADFVEFQNEDGSIQLPSIDVDLSGEGQCVLLRDGQRYDCIWRRGTNKEGMLQFFDVNNNVMPFKPGQIWFNVASTNYAKPKIAFLP